MLEIRFHGRGGQGIVVGSGILGMAYFYEGYCVQFYPEFGVERRGAPVQVFLRVSDQKIKAHYNIYEPDHIVLFSNSLIDSVDVLNGLKAGGRILINSPKGPEEFDFDKKYKIATVDADLISLKNCLGNASSPIINAAVAGAFAKISGNVSIGAVLKAIEDSVPVKVEENKKSAMTAYDSVRMM